MNSLRTLSIAMAAATLFINPTHAQPQGGLTREQVKAELAEAIRSGELRAVGEFHLRLRDLHPGRYAPAPAGPAPKTRQQVRLELEQARADGTLIEAGELGLPRAEIAPHLFGARPPLFGKTRDEVKAELALARRLGDVAGGEDSRTLAEIYPEVYAPARAEHLAATRARTAKR
jgi:hypothetical protein